jgi:AraC family transcriptional regulator
MSDLGRPIPNSRTIHGQTLRRLEIDGLLFCEASYLPFEGNAKHAHESAYLTFVIQGGCERISGGNGYRSDPLSLIYHPVAVPHSSRWGDRGGRILHIEITPPRLEQLRRSAPIMERPAEFLGGVTSWLAGRVLHELRQTDEVSPWAMEGLTLELLAETLRSRPDPRDRRPPRWLRRALELIHDRFAENPTLGAVAAEVGIHPEHLAREFRRHYNCTLGDYARRLKVEFARDRFAATQAPLVEVALAAGFADQSQFTKAFRRVTGITPAAYRKIRAGASDRPGMS